MIDGFRFLGKMQRCCCYTKRGKQYFIRVADLEELVIDNGLEYENKDGLYLSREVYLLVNRNFAYHNYLHCLYDYTQEVALHKLNGDIFEFQPFIPPQPSRVFSEIHFDVVQRAKNLISMVSNLVGFHPTKFVNILEYYKEPYNEMTIPTLQGAKLSYTMQQIISNSYYHNGEFWFEKHGVLHPTSLITHGAWCYNPELDEEVDAIIEVVKQSKNSFRPLFDPQPE